jgi:hypothetical protein
MIEWVWFGPVAADYQYIEIQTVAPTITEYIHHSDFQSVASFVFFFHHFFKLLLLFTFAVDRCSLRCPVLFGSERPMLSINGPELKEGSHCLSLYF